MIVDYNYIPYAQYDGITAAHTFYPPSKNNKGFIIFIGQDSVAQLILPTINFYNTDGSLVGITLAAYDSGSFRDLYLQFGKRETVATTTQQSYDVALSRAGNNDAAFYPITYHSMNFPAVPGYIRQPLIITLY